MAMTYASRAADATKQYFDKWLLIVNQSKTKSLCINKKLPKRDTQVMLAGAPIVRETELKLLGSTFSNRHYYLANMRVRRSNANKAYYAFCCLSGPKAKLNTKNKSTLFKSIYRPLLTYGCEIWTDYLAKASWKRLQAFQNKVLKAALGRGVRSSTTKMKEELNIISIRKFCIAKRDKFKSDCEKSHHLDVKKLFDLNCNFAMY
ncbi:hypothetical protein FOCC_FOCC012438 [Frankliniella occidentalis]|nr:hypothetical protein FOCC_FOCC012438 [Frankliniella occidentalis]